MPETIPSLANLIAGEPAPVGLLDTCSLLDVIRIPHREDIPVGSLQAAVSLVRRTQAAPRGVWLVAAELVTREWEEHRHRIAEESRIEIAKLERRLSRLNSLARYAFPLESATALDLGRLGMHHFLMTAGQTLLATTHILAVDDDCVLRARTRLTTGTPPAARGKQEYKDCEIFEHYLSLGRTLRTSGFQPSLFFVSSNTKDYGTPNHLDPQLDADLRSAGIQFVTSFDWLEAQLS